MKYIVILLIELHRIYWMKQYSLSSSPGLEFNLFNFASLNTNNELRNKEQPPTVWVGS